MSASPNDLRSPLARVRGLGSAKNGSGHWLTLRLTALALAPLGLWFVGGLVRHIAQGDYTAARMWLASPCTAVLMVVLLVVGFHHAANGLQEILEDYVHGKAVRLTSLIAIKFAGVLLAAAGIFSVLKIAFGG